MDEKIVKQLQEEMRLKLINEYGYCGVMESDKFILLNSGKGNIQIKITWE